MRRCTSRLDASGLLAAALHVVGRGITQLVDLISNRFDRFGTDLPNVMDQVIDMMLGAISQIAARLTGIVRGLAGSSSNIRIVGHGWPPSLKTLRL